VFIGGERVVGYRLDEIRALIQQSSPQGRQEASKAK